MLRTLSVSVITGVTLVSCSPAAPLLPQSDTFERSFQCSQRFEAFQKNLVADDRPPYTTSYLAELFYSPSLHTCVAAFHTDYESAVPEGPNVAYMIQDALSRHIVWSTTIREDTKAEAKWKSKQEELRK